VFVPFFGVPCGTPNGPALLALHTGAALMAAYCVREPDDTYRVICLPPLEVVSTGDALADQTRIMTEANAILESVVKRYPTQWLWLHDRWKGTFQEQNRHRLPPGYDYDRLERRRNGEA
jgi:KDO2-lipid IV(A) lauroyltransferase